MPAKKELPLHLRFGIPALALLALAGCATTTLPIVPIPVPLPRISFLWSDEISFARRDWTAAVERLAEQMREEYAYTEPKALNWDAIQAELVTRCETAEANEDKAAYAEALLNLGITLNDPNFRIEGIEEPEETVELDTGDVLTAEMLEGGVALIRVRVLAPTLGSPFPGRAFRAAVKQAAQLEARGLILDLRGANTGLDEFAAEIAGHFADQPGTYRDLAFLDEKTGDYVVDPSVSIEVSPQLPPITLPTLVLVDARTRHAAEGLAWFLQRHKRVQVAGATPTAGAPLLPERIVHMPDRITLAYPRARWVGPEGRLPLTPDASGKGGVQPDLTLPAGDPAAALEAARAHLVGTLDAAAVSTPSK